MKFLFGVVGLSFLFGLIYGPLFLFSDLNPTNSLNHVTKLTLEVGILYDHNNYHSLYVNKMNDEIEISTSRHDIP